MQCPSERRPEFSTRIKGSFVLPAKNKAPVVYHYQDLGEILHAQMFACMDKKIYISMHFRNMHTDFMGPGLS